MWREKGAIGYKATIVVGGVTKVYNGQVDRPEAVEGALRENISDLYRGVWGRPLPDTAR
jgi:hypothetical protein